MRALTTSLLLVLLGGCGAVSVTGATRKWVGPVVTTPTGGTLQTSIYYGPWLCSRSLMNACRQQCVSEAHQLMGCMWLADIKMDGTGRIGPLPTAYGGRLAITHCCCDYPTGTDTSERRKKWDATRDSLRRKWGKQFGEWPADKDGNLWQGHHIRDLHHGGDPTGLSNILPMPTDVHELLRFLYKQCYAGQGDWKKTGLNRPYSD